MDKKIYTLTNAIEMNLKHPDTFMIPTSEDIMKIENGSVVKLIFSEGEETPSERMWVKVKSIEGDDCSGVLNNDPEWLESIKYDDKIIFKKKHIVDIWEK